MQIYVIEKSAFDKLVAKIEELETRFNLPPSDLPFDKLYQPDEVCTILGVGRRTLENYRNQGRLAFIKLGRKVMYRAADIEVFLSENYKN